MECLRPENLKQVPQFGQFTKVRLHELGSSFRQIVYSEGEDVFREGSACDAFYIIESGHVEVLRDNRKVAAFGTGVSFGETFFTAGSDNTRSATIRASVGCVIHRLHKREWTKFQEAIGQGSGNGGKPTQMLIQEEGLAFKKRWHMFSAEDVLTMFKSEPNRIVEYLQDFDDDRSGTITKEEFKRGLEKMQIFLTSTQFDRLFGMIDVDGGGCVDYKEFLTTLKDPNPFFTFKGRMWDSLVTQELSTMNARKLAETREALANITLEEGQWGGRGRTTLMRGDKKREMFMAKPANQGSAVSQHSEAISQGKAFNSVLDFDGNVYSWGETEPSILRNRMTDPLTQRTHARVVDIPTSKLCDDGSIETTSSHIVSQICPFDHPQLDDPPLVSKATGWAEGMKPHHPQRNMYHASPKPYTGLARYPTKVPSMNESLGDGMGLYRYSRRQLPEGVRESDSPGVIQQRQWYSGALPQGFRGPA